MFDIRLIVVGNLKESYWREAAAEYAKRLGAFCRLQVVELRECRLPDDPTQKEIDAALATEAKAILGALLPRAHTVALCVEGKQLSTEELAAKLREIRDTTGALNLIIGSSHGLSPEVKAAAATRLSVSKLTLPHQMMRVFLLETVYRSLTVIEGRKYHK